MVTVLIAAAGGLALVVVIVLFAAMVRASGDRSAAGRGATQPKAATQRRTASVEAAGAGGARTPGSPGGIAGTPDSAEAAATAERPDGESDVSGESAEAASTAEVETEDLPDELKNFSLIEQDKLASAFKQTLLTGLRKIRKPPGSINTLISPRYLSSEDAKELTRFIMREPMIAAKVLATVNSPYYGLQAPIVSVGQAVTFLGLNAVRAIAMRTLTADSFRISDPELQRVCDHLWASATIASEICHWVAQKSGMADPGALSTQTLLSFFGNFAVLTMFPERASQLEWNEGLIARTLTEQEQLGVDAHTLGGMLMLEWRLPSGVIDGVLDVGRVLVSPPERFGPQRAARLGICYASARLAERIAFQGEPDTSAFDFREETAPEYFFLNRYFDLPELSRFHRNLHAPDTQDFVKRFVRTLLQE